MFVLRGRTPLGALVLALAAALGGAVPASADVYTDAVAAIEAKRQREAGFLGAPVTDVIMTPVLQGAFQHFEDGASIYWSPNTGARLVYGEIRARWERSGWEEGAYGFPLRDEYDAPSCGTGGRRSDFEGGSICWTPDRGIQDLARFNLKVVRVRADAGGLVVLRVRSGAPTGVARTATCGTATGQTAATTVEVGQVMNHRLEIDVRTKLRASGQWVNCMIVGDHSDRTPEAYTKDNWLGVWVD